ncbi:hypothetical protein ENH_00011380 [Eimeria necatrix]|uniref:Uncharacterized protein n=1 Tax=Eimeria necatrix TaxID=51315 RepID=U6MTR4_9EIME|nr:hypothetical protein ENH_00011380 [Eimeria necatrix]CDJ65864.1 hypothetical protein ENH_00011380 [Eimeria necatrix]
MANPSSSSRPKGDESEKDKNAAAPPPLDAADIDILKSYVNPKP